MKSIIQHALLVLKRGGIIIYPTETAYAIGCDATNRKAVEKIYKLKGREKGKPLPLIVADTKMAKRYAVMTPLARRLAARYWPGPLTMVLTIRFAPHRSSPTRGGRIEEGGRLARGVSARDGTVALRVSSHPVARTLARGLGRPIVATSANRSGQRACYSVKCVVRSMELNRHPEPRRDGRGEGSHTVQGVGFLHSPYPPRRIRRVEAGGSVEMTTLFLLDGGRLARRPPSTIVDARGTLPQVRRQGAIRVEL